LCCTGQDERVQPQLGDAIISELMARNDSCLTDEDGDYSDWIEIHNPDSADIDLTGWCLTDDQADLTKWRFPPVTLKAGGYVVVFASGKDRSVSGSELHANFKLRATGEYLALVGPDEWTVIWEYAPEYPPQLRDRSYGLGQSNSEGYLATSSPCSANGSLTSPPQLGKPIITEFMACSSGLLSDLDGDQSEWIEIHNPQSTDLDLAGWYLTDDPADTAKWQFPATTLAAGAYVVVFASNKDRYAAGGELHTNFKLRGRGGYLALVAPDGQTIISEYGPTYPAQFDGVSYGVDEAGRERYFVAPTPGSRNGAAQADMGPVISTVAHTPAQPSTADPIAVTAAVAETHAPVSSVVLQYRVMYNDTITVEMHDDGQHADGRAGDSVYGALIPADAHQAGEMVRYYVSANDTEEHLSRWPLFQDPSGSPEYLGTMISDPNVVTALPVLYWFIDRHVDAKTRTGTRCSLFYGGDFYDNVYVRVRGGVAEYWRKKNFKFDFNKGHYFRFTAHEAPVEEFDLNSTYSDKAYVRRILAWETYRDAGVPYCVAFPLRVQRNGEFYSVAVFVEHPDERYLERQGLDPEGSLYKMHNGLWSSTDQVKKVTRLEEDHSDLQELKEGHQLSGREREAYLFDNVNIPAAINYLAATVIMHDRDCGHKNYYLYRDTLGTGEWTFLPWDKDLTFGRNVVAEEVLTDTIWADQHPPLKVVGENRLIRALYETPRIREMYLRRLRTLMDQLLQPPSTPGSELRYEGRIDDLVVLLRPDVALDAVRWTYEWGAPQSFAEAIEILKRDYLAARRENLYGNPGPDKDGWVPDEQPDGITINIGGVEVAPVPGDRAEEYFTLVNPHSQAVDISGWAISGGVEHVFQPGVVITAGGVLYVSPDVVAFRNRRASPTGGEGLFVQGDYAGSLSTSSGTLELYDTEGNLVDSFTYAVQ
jgi:hypothetical protein